MKLELKKRTVAQLSTDLAALPLDATPQVAGGTTPTITVTTVSTVTTALTTSRWLCDSDMPTPEPSPEPPCTCSCCP